MRSPPREIVSEQSEANFRKAACIPSKAGVDYWLSWWSDGQRFSDFQIREMRKLEIDQATVETFTVYVSVPSPGTIRKPYRAIVCPKIAQRGRAPEIQIIAPNGHPKWVYADGYVSAEKPSKVPAWKRAA